jgi:hypothetical protein
MSIKEVYLYKKLGCQNSTQARKRFEGLYVNKRFPMERISEILGVSISTVFKWLYFFNIPIRRYKYKKYDFSGNPKEKAYILGLVAGDICAYKHYRQIVAELTTTHPAMMNLFHSVFKEYSTPTKRVKYNKITGRYERVGYVLLNNSFEFMLSKNFDIDNEYFYYFLAGFFDSEGCIHVYNNHGYIGASILMYNSNKKLLEIIKKRLEKDGFHPKFYRFFKKGEKTTNNYIRGNDLWTVAMYTIKEILTLMSRMPIKHKEKIDKIKIVSSSNSNKWELIADQVNDLKMKIKKEVKEFIKP